MAKFKTYNMFVSENKKHNWSGRFNKSNYDNNYVGAFGHTFNKIEKVDSIEDAEKILKDRGINYTERIEGYNGMAHYRCKPEWTNYVVGMEPKTGETYTSSMTIAAYDPKSKRLFTEPTDVMKNYHDQNDPHLSETIGTVNAPVYDEEPEEFPEIAVEKKDPSKSKRINEIGKLLRELYTSALNNEYNGHKIKDALYPKYKGTRVKMNITEEGNFMFDSFGRYPDILIHLDKMKEGKHDAKTIEEEIKKHVKKLNERMPGMPSMSQIASFAD